MNQVPTMPQGVTTRIFSGIQPSGVRSRARRDSISIIDCKPGNHTCAGGCGPAWAPAGKALTSMPLAAADKMVC